MNINRVFLGGNLTRDPEMRYTPSNTPVVIFGIAINERWKDRNTGEQRERTCFVDCTAFNRTAEVIAEYFHKGSRIFIEGKLQLDQWEDQEGNKRSKLKAVVERFEFVDRASDQQDHQQPAPQQQQRQAPPQRQAPTRQPAPDHYEQPIDDDEIPF